MLAKFDDFLNSVTMYRLMLYCLSWLIGIAILLSFTGILPYSPWALIGSFFMLSIVGFIVTIILERVYRLPHNFESPIITSFILFFILAPPTDLNMYLGLGVGTLAALVSKYVINWHGAHIFNPAAIGAFVASLTGLISAAWWVATPILLPFVIIIGILILRKTRQFSMFFAFAFAAVCLLIMNGVSWQALTSYPIVFLGTIMLTEPATMPSNFRMRIIFGVIVGTVFGSLLNFSFISTSPHLALLIGNLFAFIAYQRSGHLLKLIERKRLSPTTYEFSFEKPRSLNYRAGQYFAWTLDKVKFDSRGNRRNFTIASAPHEKDLKLGIKFYKPSSQFKKSLLELKKGEDMHVSALSGNFVLPKDPNKKLLFIAGGIGVTPFHSMVKELVYLQEKRDITLFYFAKNEEVLYKNLWKDALAYGINVIPFTNEEKLNESLLKKYVPDFKGRDFYLSGPPYMVRTYAKILRELSISRRNIHTDYFSGY